MKLVKPGRPQSGWAQEFACTGEGNRGGGCGAVLLVEQDDVFRTFSSHYDGSTDNYNTFKCSACGVETDLPEDISLAFTPPTKADWLKSRRSPTPEEGTR